MEMLKYILNIAGVRPVKDLLIDSNPVFVFDQELFWNTKTK